jgi:pimeloyl-ACP methyl ester carboxylesterase
MRKGYADGPFGQIHWRATGSGGQPDLICLHPAPFSGLAFTGIMPFLAEGRRVIAPDFPGHGGSDPYRTDPSIADYAAAITALVDAMSAGGPVDLFGFHTGCLVAVETALLFPDKVRRIALVDVPAYDAAQRAEYLQSVAQPYEITPDMDCLASAWDRGITKRIESQGMERSWGMFVETLRHGSAMNAAFHAGFSYDVEAQLPQLTHPTMVLASGGMLLEPSRRAAAMIPNAKLVERPDITRAVLDEAAKTVAAKILEFLNL